MPKKSVKFVKAHPNAMKRVARIWSGGAAMDNGTLARILGEWRMDRIRLCISKELFKSIMADKSGMDPYGVVRKEILGREKK